MIEVEKKFILGKEDISRLVSGADFIGEKVMDDTYYDYGDLRMMKDDNYLRRRDGRYELKLTISETRGDGRDLDRYREIENSKEVRDWLGLGDGVMEEELDAVGIIPFAHYLTTRSKYRKEGFGIDVDTADFGFDIAEIELMVGTEDEVDDAKQRIYKFAEQNGLKISYIEGKLLEYMKRNNPGAYKEVKKAWVSL